MIICHRIHPMSCSMASKARRLRCRSPVRAVISRAESCSCNGEACSLKGSQWDMWDVWDIYGIYMGYKYMVVLYMLFLWFLWDFCYINGRYMDYKGWNGLHHQFFDGWYMGYMDSMGFHHQMDGIASLRWEFTLVFQTCKKRSGKSPYLFHR